MTENASLETVYRAKEDPVIPGKQSRFWMWVAFCLAALCLILSAAVVYLAADRQRNNRFQMTTSTARAYSGATTPIVYRLDKRTGETWIIYRTGTTKKCRFDN